MRKFAFFMFLSVSSSVFADDMIECFDGLQVMAQFSPKSIVCNTNQFLPANSQSLQCVDCPHGYICNQESQTYYFSETKSSGIDYSKITNSASNVCAKNMPIQFYAKFKIAERNCSPGYYLGADDIECTLCPTNSYCPGGTYTFNETTPQGIIECPSNHPFAPAGMWLESQCGRKLHVGNDVLYMHQNPSNPTTHRLFVQYGNITYSANAVLRDTTPGADFPKMSYGMTTGLHVKIHETINGTEDDYEYLICDDSICPY